MARSRYHAKPLTQRMKFQGQLIGCTDTAFAMCVDATTLGGCIVTELLVRKLSNETKPDPESPGLNLTQLEDVADKLHVEFTGVRGGSRANLEAALRNNRRVVAQLWYAGIGGGNIGHAVYVESVGKTLARIVDPIKGKYQNIDKHRLYVAMETWAVKVGYPKGSLLYGQSRPTQWLAPNQKPGS